MNLLLIAIAMAGCACEPALAQVISTNKPLQPPIILNFNPAAPPALKPGVYKTEPFSCLILVPGAHPDDRIIIGTKGAQRGIPTFSPELRFIPWTQKK